jgi:hypothetical protein
MRLLVVLTIVTAAAGSSQDTVKRTRKGEHTFVPHSVGDNDFALPILLPVGLRAAGVVFDPAHTQKVISSVGNQKVLRIHMLEALVRDPDLTVESIERNLRSTGLPVDRDWVHSQFHGLRSLSPSGSTAGLGQAFRLLLEQEYGYVASRVADSTGFSSSF